MTPLQAQHLGSALASVFASPDLQVALQLELQQKVSGDLPTWTDGGCSVAAAALRRWFPGFHFVGVGRLMEDDVDVLGRTRHFEAWGVAHVVVEHDGWAFDAKGLYAPDRAEHLIALRGPVPSTVKRVVALPDANCKVVARWRYMHSRGLARRAARAIHLALGPARPWGLELGVARSGQLRPRLSTRSP